MNLGENIYRLRTERNMSQGDLADALEVSRQSVSKWENNSAVPELEKLVKMAQLFGVSLDELVKDERTAGSDPVPPTSHTTAPSTPTEPSHNHKLTTAQIAGIILLAFGALCFIVFTVVGLFTEGILLGIIIALPFLLCGTVCLLCKKNIGLLCGWAVYLPIWFVCTILIVLSYGTMAHLIGGSLLLFGVALTIITIKRMLNGRLDIAGWLKCVLAAAMILMQIITFVGQLPPMEGSIGNPFISEDTAIVTPVEPDGSETKIPG